MGASCCAQQVTEEQNSELENKYKYDPQKQPQKGAFKKSSEEKKIVKFPTRVRQEDEEKQEEDISNPLIEENADAKSRKSQKSQKSHQSQHNNKRGLFNKQVSQFVKCDDDQYNQ